MSSTSKIVPAITSLRDSKGEVPNGGSTYETSLQMLGVAAAGGKVEIFMGAISKGEVNADASGKWIFQLTGLPIGTQQVTAKNETGVSAPRSFTVKAS